MVEPGGGERTAAQPAGRADRAIAQQISYLDQALWKNLGEATTAEAFARHWLTLQCRMVPDVTRGHVLFGPPEIGPFTPLARWPEHESECLLNANP